MDGRLLPELPCVLLGYIKHGNNMGPSRDPEHGPPDLKELKCNLTIAGLFIAIIVGLQ